MGTFGTMPARGVTFASIAAGLTVPERVMLFCLASGTDWHRAGPSRATTQHLMIKGLIERRAAGAFMLTDQGRAVFAALIERR
jgi:hypothetical protein